MFQTYQPNLAFDLLACIRWAESTTYLPRYLSICSLTRAYSAGVRVGAPLRPKGDSPIHLVNPCTAVILGIRSQMRIFLALPVACTTSQPLASSSSTYRSGKPEVLATPTAHWNRACRKHYLPGTCYSASKVRCIPVPLFWFACYPRYFDAEPSISIIHRYRSFHVVCIPLCRMNTTVCMQRTASFPTYSLSAEVAWPDRTTLVLRWGRRLALVSFDGLAHLESAQTTGCLSVDEWKGMR